MLRFITSSTSWFSTRMRAQLVANANSVVRQKPNNTNETMMRLRRRRRYGERRRSPLVATESGFRGGDSVSDAMAGLDQRHFKRLVDHRTQAVDVDTQRIRVGQLLAPHAGFQLLAGDHGRRGPHPGPQDLQGGG